MKQTEIGKIWIRNAKVVGSTPITGTRQTKGWPQCEANPSCFLSRVSGQDAGVTVPEHPPLPGHRHPRRSCSSFRA
ncbi:hypothetical protein C2U47_02135 [Aeromonas sp. ASNIH7]|nr:hypothetical protein C2U47_02135 [Aeromonas sp. ASNIH7]